VDESERATLCANWEAEWKKFIDWLVDQQPDIDGLCELKVQEKKAREEAGRSG
jgi:exonuclease III